MSLENLQQQVAENPNMQVTLLGSDLLGMFAEFRTGLVSELREAMNDAVLNARKEMLSGVHALHHEKTMTVKEVASLLDADISTLHRWNKQGVLTRRRVGGKVLYRVEDVEPILRTRKKNAVCG